MVHSNTISGAAGDSPRRELRTILGVMAATLAVSAAAAFGTPSREVQAPAAAAGWERVADYGLRHLERTNQTVTSQIWRQHDYALRHLAPAQDGAVADYGLRHLGG